MHRNRYREIYNISLSFITLISKYHRLIAKTDLLGPKGLTGKLRPGRPEICLRVSRG
jgi:hypothetical protein